jgi:adhesin HecA-like repeat protein
MFVILIHYTKSVSEVDQHKAAHGAYLDKFYADGQLVVSGRRIDQKGGVVIANMASRAEVERLIASDPYALGGVAEYEIIDFHPSKYAPDFGSFIHAVPMTDTTGGTPNSTGDVGTASR